MKRLTFIIVLLAAQVMLHSPANAQHIKISTLLEKTVAGTEYGSNISYELKSKLSFGVFYQTSLSLSKEKSGNTNSLAGLTFNMPLVTSDKITVTGFTRWAVANEKFLVFIPGLETETRLAKRLTLSAFMSLRMTYPSIGTKFNLIL